MSFQSPYVCIYEDQDDPTLPVQVLHMSEEWLAICKRAGYSALQAMYLVAAKDLPDSVKNYNGNRQIMCITTPDQLPDTRTFRNAWELNLD